MNQPKVSVIVAVFNAEKTLDRMVQSLVSQTFTDFEVLLIDDGSTDASGVICDKYARSDSRFKAFHKPNEGIGSTRQFGIDHAAGEYTIHVDSDDWVEPDYLGQLYESAVRTGADMVICDIVEDDGKCSRIIRQEPSGNDSNTVIKDILLNRIHGGPCNKLVKLDCFTKYDVKYFCGQNYGEDAMANVLLLAKGISVAYIPKALYHYERYVNAESASQLLDKRSFEQREAMAEFFRLTFKDKDFVPIHNYRYTVIAYLAIKFNFYSKDEYKTKYGFLAKLKWKGFSNYSPLSYRIIVWSSFNLSYNTARLLVFVKNLVGKDSFGRK